MGTEIADSYEAMLHQADLRRKMERENPMREYTCPSCHKTFKRSLGPDSIECPWCGDEAPATDIEPTPQLHAKHFDFTARVLSIAYRENNSGVVAKKRLVDLFATHFKKTNPNFDEGKFRRAIDWHIDTHPGK